MARAWKLVLGLLVLVLTACGAAPQEGAPGGGGAGPQAADSSVWRRQAIYLVLPDRFYNGSTANDNLGAAGCYDPANPRKFHGGDWAGLRQKLGYLKDLGMTAVWVTPAYKQVGQLGDGSCGYHGYWPDYVDPDDGALEPKLGTSSDLSGLIADLHSSTYGMKFILDMVVNHAGYNARVVSQRPSWFHSPSECTNDETCALAGLPDFKQEDPTVASYLTNLSKGWVSRFALDGIRMDTAKHVPIAYWRDSWIPGVGSVRAGLFNVAEVFREGSANDLKPYLDAGFDSAFNFPLRRALVNAFAKDGSVDQVAQRVQDDLGILGLSRHLMLTNLLDNHDVPRFVNEPGFGVPEDEIRRRYHLALAALFTLPGIPQVYYGNELGMYGGSDPDNRRDMPPWAWTTSGRTAGGSGFLPNPELTYQHVKKLASIRYNNAALYQGYYAEMWRQNGSGNPNVYAYFRGSSSNRVITALNNGAAPSGLLSIPVQSNTAISSTDRSALPDGTVLTDLLGAGAPSPITLTDGAFKANLPARGVGIYRPRSSSSASAVTFTVTASTAWGENVYLAGSTGELGQWDTGRAVRMSPSNCSGSTCTWSVTLRYLPYSQGMTFKFIKKNGAGVTWETGSDRSYTVPSSSSATYSGGSFRN